MKTLREDAPSAVRPGDAFDERGLNVWLRSTLGTGGEASVRQFPGGFSNLTYHVEVDGREFVLRRPPPGVAIRGGHDILREYRLLALLDGAYPAPHPVAACDDAEVIGTPFYLMERVHGIVLRKGDGDGVDARTAGAIDAALADALAALHALDPARFGGIGRPEGYNRRQVEGWAERYAAARTDDLPALTWAFGWLRERIPSDGAPALVHNDFKLDNAVLDAHDPSRILAVLDWEMATVGDPLLDLGTTLGYWVDASDERLRAHAFVPTDIPGSLSRRAFAEHYIAARGGREPGDLVYAYVFGLCKIAVIAQQLYARAHSGRTTDPRFARLRDVVAAMGDAAQAAITRGEL